MASVTSDNPAEARIFLGRKRNDVPETFYADGLRRRNGTIEEATARLRFKQERMTRAESSILLLKNGSKTIDMDEEDLRVMEELLSSDAEDEDGDSDASDEQLNQNDYINPTPEGGEEVQVMLPPDARCEGATSPAVQLGDNREINPFMPLIDQEFSGILKYIETVSVKFAESFGHNQQIHFE